MYASFAELTDAELIQWAGDHPLAPLPLDETRRVLRTTGGNLFIERSTTEQAHIDDYTAYDRGDLSADIDRALGDLIERVIHRYMPRDLARGVRRQICGDLADIVIDYDKSSGDTSKA